MHYCVAMLNCINLNENYVASKYTETTFSKVKAGVEIFNVMPMWHQQFIKTCMFVGFNNKCMHNVPTILTLGFK